ncbi:hypothetical protein NT26_0357 [Pseudorhizobium banfieldiae]|uniref:Uncharacterized protein n=1 Tax=Pseudorhizobium banfieldiae TaxID=1125847 RepID=L0NBA8_9HYPH|nr:hypothetical protein NT26_0357 [Pseudorhizobium banfieldiae]
MTEGLIDGPIRRKNGNHPLRGRRREEEDVCYNRESAQAEAMLAPPGSYWIRTAMSADEINRLIRKGLITIVAMDMIGGRLSEEFDVSSR